MKIRYDSLTIPADAEVIGGDNTPVYDPDGMLLYTIRHVVVKIYPGGSDKSDGSEPDRPFDVGGEA